MLSTHMGFDQDINKKRPCWLNNVSLDSRGKAKQCAWGEQSSVSDSGRIDSSPGNLSSSSELCQNQ